MKSLLTKISALLTSLVFAMQVAMPIVAVAESANVQGGQPAANIQDGLSKGTCLSTTDTNCDSGNAEASVNKIITTVINIFSLIVGVVSVIMIIIGGLKYITSGGDSGNVSGAKNTILYAIVGLVIVALAQVIVRFVLGRITDGDTSGGGTL